MVRDDLPEPLTPVTQVKVPSGKAAVTPARLLAVAPWTVTYLPLTWGRGLGGGVLGAVAVTIVERVLARPGEVSCGVAVGAGEDVDEGSGADTLAAVNTRAGAH